MLRSCYSLESRGGLVVIFSMNASPKSMCIGKINVSSKAP